MKRIIRVVAIEPMEEAVKNTPAEEVKVAKEMNKDDIAQLMYESGLDLGEYFLAFVTGMTRKGVDKKHAETIAVAAMLTAIGGDLR